MQKKKKKKKKNQRWVNKKGILNLNQSFSAKVRPPNYYSKRLEVRDK